MKTEKGEVAFETRQVCKSVFVKPHIEKLLAGRLSAFSEGSLPPNSPWGKASPPFILPSSPPQVFP